MKPATNSSIPPIELCITESGMSCSEESKMAGLDVVDFGVLFAIVLVTLVYLTKRRSWGLSDFTKKPALQSSSHGSDRDFVKAMSTAKKNCIVFYGSQTGTAEGYAQRLAKEAQGRFSLESMVASLEDYDFDNLDQVPEDSVVMFILATYGEGEPTDNAVSFFDFVSDDNVSFEQGSSLNNLNFVAFGLGSDSYEHYNAMIRRTNSILQKLGANRIGPVGEANDNAGTTEEDFLAWKEIMWSCICEKFHLEEGSAAYQPIYQIIDVGQSLDTLAVYHGEPKTQLQGKQEKPFDLHNPFVSTILESRELFSLEQERNCLHMEFDIRGSDLSYQTGDHVAVWPINSNEEVERLLVLTGLTENRCSVIDVEPLDPTVKVPFPTPTTYSAILRYYLEICAPVSRQFVSTLAEFAPSEEIRQEMVRLGSDKSYFHEKIGPSHYNLARLLESVSNGQTWDNLPFSVLVEGFNKLQPRYYSISSSSLVQPNQISITTVVDSKVVPGRSDPFRGVATSYLLALKREQNGEVSVHESQTYNLYGPRDQYQGTQVPIHVRRSAFRLPADPSTSVIMVGPGTGVAPFRAFIQERAQQAKNGAHLGQTVLFFGCRNSTEDFIYQSEWAEYSSLLDDKFKLITAFSRAGKKKTYVQHRLLEHEKEVARLLTEGAYIYVCGDAGHMAREVLDILEQILASSRGISMMEAKTTMQQLKACGRYQEDVW